MMEMLEDISSVTMFIQVPMFGILLAAVMFQMETVSNWEKKITIFSFNEICIFGTWYISTRFYPAETFLPGQNIANLSLAAAVNVCEICFFAINIYVLCYYISLIMIIAVSIGDTAYESQWYRLTRDDQVIVEMIIRRAQRPYEIKGLGVFVCSLEAYVKVSDCNWIGMSGGR